MRRTINDEQFEQALTGAQRSLFRFEQQPAYAIDDEGGLFTAFQRGELIEPDQAPGLRAWFEQVHDQTTYPRNMVIERVRVVDSPLTEYQRWLQYVDHWNRAAGEEIYYLPRPVYQAHRTNERSRFWTPFGPGTETADWWLIDGRVALIMHIADGVRTRVEAVEGGTSVALAIQFQWQARETARRIAADAAARTNAEIAQGARRAA